METMIRKVRELQDVLSVCFINIQPDVLHSNSDAIQRIPSTDYNAETVTQKLNEFRSFISSIYGLDDQANAADSEALDITEAGEVLSGIALQLDAKYQEVSTVILAVYSQVSPSFPALSLKSTDFLQSRINEYGPQAHLVMEMLGSNNIL